MKNSVGLLAAVGIGVAALLLSGIPVEFWLPQSTMLTYHDQPALFMNNLTPYGGVDSPLYRGLPVNIRIGPLGYLMIISPAQNDLNTFSQNNTEIFCEFYKENKIWLENKLFIYGGYLFRGFGIHGAENFDRIIGAIHEDLKVEVKKYPITCLLQKGIMFF